MGLFKRNTLPYADFVAKVNRRDWSDLADDGLREALEQNTGDDVLLYGLLKEIIRRKTGLTLFDTQLAAAYSLQKGRIAELPTGEGKTLAAVVTASAAALRGESVHVLVFNDYLAKRDCEWNRSVYEFCGLTVGAITEASTVQQRREAYRCHVTYLSAKEAGFDYLRNFLCQKPEDLVAPVYQRAIVDEADSLLLDEARCPLVLAGSIPKMLDLARRMDEVAAGMFAEDEVEISHEDHQVWLNEAGIARAEEQLAVENLYDDANSELLTLLNASLEAHFLLERDVDYLVKDDAIAVVDASTGRIAENRRFPDILHRAVEIKEQVPISRQTMIFNSITIQDFLSLYQTLSGMTGTIRTSAKEIRNIYDLEVDVIPPHIPCIRVDHDDVVCESVSEKTDAVIQEVEAAWKKGQPVLLGTQSVAESERYSKLLTQRGIEHVVLNARNDEQEAAYIAHAGEPYRVTVSTNMAGRGVDIKLGGPEESEKDFVVQQGGLYVISTGLNPSVRIDNQLRGRSGRQGDPGESKFFASIDDPLFAEYFEQVDRSLHASQEELFRLIRRIQSEEEGARAENRYMLGKYSYILEEQRKVISAYRMNVLKGDVIPDAYSKEEPDRYSQLVASVGRDGVERAEQQLVLYYINHHWANYLSSMEDVRSGIHLMVVGGKSPVDEYQKIAVSSFDEMTQDIQRDVFAAMSRCTITEHGIDMEGEGLSGATTTWTYMIDDTNNQFNCISRWIKNLSNMAGGTLLSARQLYQKLRKRD